MRPSSFSRRQARPDVCPWCRKSVIWVHRAERLGAGPVAVEKCAFGAGRVALSTDLVTGGLVAREIRGLKTGYRFHAGVCGKPRSHYGEALGRRKVRP